MQYSIALYCIVPGDDFVPQARFPIWSQIQYSAYKYEYVYSPPYLALAGDPTSSLARLESCTRNGLFYGLSLSYLGYRGYKLACFVHTDSFSGTGFD